MRSRLPNPTNSLSSRPRCSECRRVGRLLSWLVVAISLCVVASTAQPDPAEAGSAYYLHSNWNNYKVYLSPAYHYGGNVGCDGYVEDSNSEGAPKIAREAASGYGTDLLDRGYYIKVRWGVNANTKVSDSNAWGADIHIPIHSNAKSQNCGASSSYGGTIVMWQKTSQQSFATTLKNAVGPASPGTNDYICYAPSCSSYSSLAELAGPNALAAYLEAEFHTYSLGVSWLRSRNWTWRIGMAVDQYLGYP